jgi:hypothetical protein
MNKLFHLGGGGHVQSALTRQVRWLSTQRNLFFVPRQSPAAQTPRPSGLFGVLVSPHR